MSIIDELLARNQAAGKNLDDGRGNVRPSRRLAIVTCMDSRLNIFAMLGLRHGEAHILRNAGGVVTDDMIRSPDAGLGPIEHQIAGRPRRGR